jgi:hypothetical protein
LEEGALLTKIETAKNLPSAIDAQVS